MIRPNNYNCIFTREIINFFSLNIFTPTILGQKKNLSKNFLCHKMAMSKKSQGYPGQP